MKTRIVIKADTLEQARQFCLDRGIAIDSLSEGATAPTTSTHQCFTVRGYQETLRSWFNELSYSAEPPFPNGTCLFFNPLNEN